MASHPKSYGHARPQYWLNSRRVHRIFKRNWSFPWIAIVVRSGQLRSHQLLLRAYRPDFVLDLVVLWCKIVVSTVNVHVMTILRVTLTYMSCAEARPGTRRHTGNRAPTHQTSPIPLLPASPCSHTVTSGGPSLPGACPALTSAAHLPPISCPRTPLARLGATRRRLDRRCFRRNAA